jgi:SWI/SNF-related matrix-associated actin-dependent regulator of chromatin subfamily B protein 1
VVTPVPLAQSQKLIPPLLSDEIAEIKQWMHVDREYEAMFQAMRDHVKGEAMRMYGGRARWWERGVEVDTAVAARRGKSKFELVYPHMMDGSASSRKKGRRRMDGECPAS